MRELTPQDGWKTDDGRVTNKYRVRLGMHSLAPHFFVNLPSWDFQPSCCVRSPYSGEERPGSLISRPRKWQRSLPYFLPLLWHSRKISALSVAEQCFSFCYPHHPTKLFSLNWGTFSKSTLHFLPEKFIFVTRIALLSQQQLIYFHIKRKSVIGRPIPAEVKRGFCGSGENEDILKIWKRMKKCFWGLFAKKQQQQQQQYK